MNHAEAFVWWLQRSPGGAFPYVCSGCGTQLPLRQRVTQKKRVCPGCGSGITVGAIDAMLAAWEVERQRRLTLEMSVSCPRCGFKYAWKGGKCRHCRFES